ncbi:hypothetical protein [Salsuginibacillus kocurii]|uniref:hypothetical protein n=1 Tax=Salsuginibacillus kocurii TaxID=427078 RepID=UPI00036A5640|nr:hypothetical protein [Salsuginibacillus kocurii]
MNLAGEWEKRVSISRGLMLFGLAVLFILSTVMNLPLDKLLVGLTVILILYSLPFMAFFPKIMTIALFSVGHLVFFTQNLSVSYWQAGLIENLPLVALFVSVPLFAYPLQNGGYVEYVSRLVHRFLKTPFKIFSNIVILTSSLSTFMNLGSVRISFELFKEDIQRDPKFYTRAISQGFSLAMCWSPYFAGVAIVLNMLNLPIFPFIFWGLLLMISGTLVAILLVSKEAKIPLPQVEAAVTKEPQDKGASSWKKAIELLIVFVGMFASIFIFERMFDINLIILISVIAFIYPLLWAVLIKRTKEFVQSLGHYKDDILPRIHNEAILFIAAAFFAQMVQMTDVSIMISDFFTYLNSLSPFLVIFITILVIVVLGVVGIHQILTVSLIGASISLTDLAISIEALGLALIAGWSLSTAVSPVAALNLTLGNLLSRSPIKIGMWNAPYVLLASVILSFLIFGINALTL